MIAAQVTSPAAALKTTELLGSIPLYFEQNRGQAPNEVDYITRAAGRNVLISATHADMVIPGGAVRMFLEGARSVRPESLDPLRAQVNYLLGTHRDQWITHVSTWQRVRYPGVYPGIDLIYHGTGAQLEYDFVIAPDTDPSLIRLRIEGSQPIRLDASGDAVLQAGDTAIHLRAPTLYQEIVGARQPVEGRYRVDAANTLSFAIGDYDHARALVIDPVIVWAGTLGSSSAITYSQGGIVVDSDGNSYVGGSGGPPDVPSSVPQHPLVMLGQGSTPFVAKLDPGGTLLWISYVHGSSHLAVDSTRSVWAVDGGAGDKLSPAGDALIGNFTLFDSTTAIAVDGSDNVYVSGRSTVFKMTPSATQIYTTTLLSQSTGQIAALALDSSANVYIAGQIYTGGQSAFASVPFIGTPPSNSQGAAFAARMKPDGSGLMWAAYVAGVGTAIAASQDNNVWLTGYTNSTSLPVTPGAFSSSNAGGYDGFIAKMDNAGTAIAYLSYLGGTRGDFPGFLAVASDNSVFIAGSTQSADFPTVNPIINPAAAESVSLFATTDGGVTWHRADASLPGIAIGISADPSPGTLVAVTDSGLYRSTNNGTTWQQQQASFFNAAYPSSRPFFMRDVSNPSIVWLGGESIRRSDDAGLTWTGVGGNGVDLSPVPGDPSTVYVITQNGQLDQSIYNPGGSPIWSLNYLQISTSDPLLLTNIRVGLDGVIYVLGEANLKNDAQGAIFHWSGIGLAPVTGPPYQTSLGVSATNASVIYAAIGGKLYRTADAGAHWSAGTQSPAGAIARITVAPSNDLAVWAVTGPDQPCGTATLTKNGGQTWTAPFADLAGVCVIAVAVSPSDPNTAWAVASPKTFGFLGRMSADGTGFQYSTLLPDVPLGFTTNGNDAFLTGSTTPGQFALAGGATATGSPQYAALFVERIGAAGQQFCSYSVSPSSLYAWTPSTALSINVTAAGGCAWSLSGVPSWLNVTSAAAGSGNGVVTLAAASNPTGETRTASLTVAGKTVTVTQPAATCIYFMTPVVSAIGAAGGIVQITLSTDSGCPWTITNESPSSLTVQSPVSGSGGTVVQVLASANPSQSDARQLRLDVATSPVIISQAAGNCSYALSFDSPADGPVLGPQAQGSLVHVVTGTACSWKALGNALWINPGAGATGKGNGSVQVALSANATGITRSGGVVVGDQVLQITQNAAALGSWVLNATLYPAGAGSVLVAPPAADGSYSTGTRVCLTPSANAGWIFSGWTGDPLDSSNCVLMTANMNVTANFSAAPPSAALNFVPVAPCRVADTRDANGPFGGPFIAGQAVRDFVIPSSACGIPASAQAYSLNVAVVPHGPLGYLTVWPAGQAQPVVATLNSTDGRIKSNAAIVPAGAAGAISLFVTNPADVVLDINGYFVLASEPGSLQFYPVTPCRVGDTRDPAGPFGGPGIPAGGSRTFPIPASPCNVPATAQAYSFNFAAVPQEPLYLTAWPNGQAMPLVASLNAAHLVATSNAVIVPAGTAGAVDVFASGATDLVIDINGYFAPPGTGGLSLYNLQPCRVTDTRNPAGSPPFNGAIDIDPTASGCGTLSTAQAYVFNATVVPPGPLGFLTLWPQGTPQPLVASLNATEGAITGNMAIVPTGNGSISAFGSQPTHLVLDIFGYFAP